MDIVDPVAFDADEEGGDDYADDEVLYGIPSVWGIDGDIIAYRCAYMAQKEGGDFEEAAGARASFSPSSIWRGGTYLSDREQEQLPTPRPLRVPIQGQPWRGG